MSTRTAPTTIDLATGRRRSMTEAEVAKLKREAELLAADDYAARHAAIVERMNAPVERCESGYLIEAATGVCPLAGSSCSTCVS